VLAAAASAPIALALPNYHPAETHAGTGPAPDGRRYRLAIVTTALAFGAFSCIYTYVSPFLTKVAGLALHDVAAVLLVTGAATAGGVFAGSVVSRQRADIAPLVPVAVLAPVLVGVYFAGRVLPAAIVLIAAACGALGAYNVTNQNRILEVAPASTDIASAWTSASCNAGTAGGFPRRRFGAQRVRASSNGPARRSGGHGRARPSRCSDAPAAGHARWEAWRWRKPAGGSQ